MATTTQDKRLMRIATPLGQDFVLINTFTAHEGLSKLFNIDVELRVVGGVPREPDPGRVPE